MSVAEAPAVQYRFNRPVWRVVFHLVAAPIGAILFGGFALAIFFRWLPGPDSMRLQLSLLIGFFAVLLGLAAVVTFRRGLRRTLLEIDAQGLWTPEMGQLAWTDVDDIRVESYLSPSGRRYGQRMVHRERLGIVPRPGANVRPAKTASAAGGLTRAFYRYLESRVPGLKTGFADLAPFGVEAYELDRPLQEVVARVQEFHNVTRPAGPQ